MPIPDFRKKQLQALVIFGAAIIFITLLYFAFGQILSQPFHKGLYMRLGSITKYLDGFEPGEDTVVAAFGPSDIALNFSPRLLQQSASAEGRKVRGLNFGAVMIGPDIMHILTRRAAKALEERNKKFDLAILRFMPMMYTKEYSSLVADTLPYYAYAAMNNSDSNSLLYSSPELFAKIQYLRLVEGGFGQAELIFRLRRWLSEHTRFMQDKDRAPSLAWEYPYFETLSVPEADADGSYWNSKTGGEIDIFAKQTPIVTVPHRQDFYNVGYIFHRSGFGFLDFNFEEKYFVDLDKMIAELGRVSRKVVVLYLPDFIRAGYPQVSEAGKKRLEQRLKNLRDDKRITFLDYSTKWHPEETDYMDLTHMTPEGKVKFNAILAADILKELGPNRGSSREK